jgi:hypothetical protein
MHALRQHEAPGNCADECAIRAAASAQRQKLRIASDGSSGSYARSEAVTGDLAPIIATARFLL